MSGICDTCKRSNVCRKPLDGMDSCRLYVSGKESNYQRLFGTPERAARTIAAMMDKCSDRPHGCDGCMLFDVCDDEANALKWLRGDAE